MRTLQSALLLIILQATSTVSFSATYYVSLNGSNGNPGTKEKPFRSIQEAADLLRPGDTCYVREGVYRESVLLTRSGKPGKPICLAAYPGEKVVLDGTEVVDGTWEPHKKSIYRIEIKDDFEQLFVDGKMMINARWPNMTFDQRLDRFRWQRVDKESSYGKIVSNELAETGIDWTGALATLNISHQWWSWSRNVIKHEKGSPILEYPTDIDGLFVFDKPHHMEDDFFYLSGILEALDAPTEWYLDNKKGRLYLYTETGDHPGKHHVAYKKRVHALHIQESDYIEIKGFTFFASTFRLQQCDHCLVEDCRLFFPTFSSRIAKYKDPSPATHVEGHHNVIRKVSLAYPNGSGLIVRGSRNIVENCIIHDANWFGTLTYKVLSVGVLQPEGEDNPYIDVETRSYNPEIIGMKREWDGNIIRQNTLFNCGNAILGFGGLGQTIVEYNHIYNGGMACRDVSLVYTGSPVIAGSVIRYNWVHGIHTERWDGGGGLGIRGDDQTRDLSVHHNVVWDCGRDGIIVKGEYNNVYNNTVFDIGKIVGYTQPGNYINIHTAPEPYKGDWGAFQWELLEEQNTVTKVFNNAALTITKNNNGLPFPKREWILHNYQEELLNLNDPEHFDFRPAKGSPLIDAGLVVPGLIDEFNGNAPDIGAYEYGGDFWQAGVDWMDEYEQLMKQRIN